ncbi:GntR family transcriptional regulator [Acidovorax sp. SRB_14]|uniref:GntR family transcriptional regulator n=1 Tax=Acidovorax sp. SRB_14 TaxID=1962699 RepID=UPI001563BD58|nr:GntR family transcriptional regulator [Acidovorax sp. SRB_14]
MTSPSHDTSAEPSPAKKSRAIQPSLAEQAYVTLKQLVLQHELRAGDQLNIIELSEQLSIGRTPLHMAIHRLAAEGLLEIVPRKGIFVRAETLESFHELLSARLLVEPYLARMASIHADAPLLEELDSIVARAWECHNADDRRGSMTADRLFHQTIYAAAGNAILTTFALSLLDRSMSMWYQPSGSPSQDKPNVLELEEMLSVFKNGTPEEVEASMRTHIETVRDKYWRSSNAKSMGLSPTKN